MINQRKGDDPLNDAAHDKGPLRAKVQKLQQIVQTMQQEMC
jgi:hypothetical protein